MLFIPVLSLGSDQFILPGIMYIHIDLFSSTTSRLTTYLSPACDFMHSLGDVACTTSFTLLMKCIRILSGSRQVGLDVFSTISQLAPASFPASGFKHYQMCWLQITYYQLIADHFL